MSNMMDELVSNISNLAFSEAIDTLQKSGVSVTLEHVPQALSKTFFAADVKAPAAPQPPSIEQRVADLVAVVADLKAVATAEKGKGKTKGMHGEEDEEKSEKAKAKMAEEEDEEKSEKAKAKMYGDSEDDEEMDKKKKAQADKEDEEKAAKASPALPWPTDCASKEFLANVARASDPLRDWGKDPV